MPMQATTTTPLFAAALKPDRSPRLSGGWVAYAIAAVATTPFAVLVPEALLPATVAFLAAGMGLAVLSVRQSRRTRMSQQVTLWPDQLEVALVDQRGIRSLRRFDPAGIRLILVRDENEKTIAMRLRTGMEELELGAFLQPEDRSSFAKAFGTALRRARQFA